MGEKVLSVKMTIPCHRRRKMDQDFIECAARNTVELTNRNAWAQITFLVRTVTNYKGKGSRKQRNAIAAEIWDARRKLRRRMKLELKERQAQGIVHDDSDNASYPSRLPGTL
jgi:predicted ATP-dependent protease